jgi:hypothetical protein
VLGCQAARRCGRSNSNSFQKMPLSDFSCGMQHISLKGQSDKTD